PPAFGCAGAPVMAAGGDRPARRPRGADRSRCLREPHDLRSGSRVGRRCRSARQQGEEHAICRQAVEREGATHRVERERRGARRRGHSMTRDALLVLTDGTEFEGEAIGADAPVTTGELVFNTALSGYQEIVTDPSYAGQVITFTYPHIGNYGVNTDD